ncbi:UNKNOWN [Stylonychia lemnae]|uniref:Uncharacterized protein n=1 Tax=Stylonychia lemnae TaxID=5949 RepID=A0A078B835_STYLE|nr:UNKNOWN [Stylonychia lemnae]|eukprot:CDW89733.1 UNKNOWN [Stylonychia lemnae]
MIRPILKDTNFSKSNEINEVNPIIESQQELIRQQQEEIKWKKAELEQQKLTIDQQMDRLSSQAKSIKQVTYADDNTSSLLEAPYTNSNSVFTKSVVKTPQKKLPSKKNSSAAIVNQKMQHNDQGAEEYLTQSYMIEDDDMPDYQSYQNELSVKGFKKKYNLIQKPKEIHSKNNKESRNFSQFKNSTSAEIQKDDSFDNQQLNPTQQQIQQDQMLQQQQQQFQRQEQQQKLVQDQIKLQEQQWQEKMREQQQQLISVIQKQQDQLQQVLINKEKELKDKEFLLEVEKLNNPKRKEEELVHKQQMNQYKNQVESLVHQQTKDIQKDLQQMEKEWQLVDHLTKEKEYLRERAVNLINEEKRKYQSDISRYKSHKLKLDNKSKSQNQIYKQLLKDIEQLKANMQQKIAELIDYGIDLDEVFYEMRDDEELKWEQKYDLEMTKSAICRQVKFRCQVGLFLTERKKNMDIQTYNVDFVLEQENMKKELQSAMQEDYHEKASIMFENEENQYRNYLEQLKKEKGRLQKAQDVESLKKQVIQEQLRLQKMQYLNSKELYNDTQKLLLSESDQIGKRNGRFLQKSLDRLRTPLHNKVGDLNKSVILVNNNTDPLSTIKYGRNSVLQNPYSNVYNTLDGSTNDNLNQPTQRFNIVDQNKNLYSSPVLSKFGTSPSAQLVQLPVINQKGQILTSSPVQQYGQKPIIQIQPMFTNSSDQLQLTQPALLIQNQDDGTNSDFEFLSNILRQNQKTEISQVMREAERRQKNYKYQMSKSYTEREKKQIIVKSNQDKLRTQEKVDNIKKKYEDKYQDLLLKVNYISNKF